MYFAVILMYFDVFENFSQPWCYIQVLEKIPQIFWKKGIKMFFENKVATE